MNIKGLTVEKVLIADAVDIEKEFYVGLINDRNTKSVVLMASAEGGVEIEEVARVSPEKIIKMSIDPTMGLMDWQARKIALQLFSNPAGASDSYDSGETLPVIYRNRFIAGRNKPAGFND
jgi:succinyl-CoA synthetase beta subunit